MVLSIGMIVKNEEKYLEQCLTALKPILENVDSELIIADTGSTDNTVEIAKKFTDNVFHFEWINDFAAARNSTLDKAKGEWYMFIDADEIIKDCTPLIEFFNSGEYKRYGSATIVIRNYNDLQNMDLYNNYNLMRITSLSNGVRFINPIHEQFSEHFSPIKNLNVIADHYGYVYKDGDKILDTANKKAERNLDLLFKELEEGERTKDVRYNVYGQIADCYIFRDDLENALKYINIGLDHCPPESYTYIWYVNKKLSILNRMKKYDEIVQLCRWYFSKDNVVRTQKLVSDSGIYFSWAFSSYNLNDYDEAINKAILGFEIYRSYLNGKLFTPELNFVGVETTIPILKQLCVIFISACVRRKKYDIAVREIDIIPIKDFFGDTSYMKLYLGARVELMEHTNYNKLPDLYYQLDKPNREMFVTILIQNIFKTQNHKHFLKKLSLIANDNERLADIIKIFNSHFIDHDLVPVQINEFINKHGTKDNETVWILMMKKNFDIMPFICAEDFDPAESVNALYNDFSNYTSALDLFPNAIIRLSANGVEKAAEAFYRAIIIATEKRLDTTKLIENLGRLGKRWAELNPNTEAPDHINFALTIGDISELHRKKHYEDCMVRINELIGDDPEQTTEPERLLVLRHYLEIVQENERKNKELMENQESNPMMIELAEQIKQSIRAMINNWDLDRAEEALNQMSKMAPFDPDIEDIRDEIIDRKVNYMKYM